VAPFFLRPQIYRTAELCYNIAMAKSYGVITQSGKYESRVCLTPDVATRLIKAGIDVVLEAGAGETAHYADEHYQKAGVTLASRDQVLKCDYLSFLGTPEPAVFSKLGQTSSGDTQTVIGLFGSLLDQNVADQFEKQKVRAIDITKLPRKLSMAQSMDIMTSQSSVAGYKAALLAAEKYAGFLPMLTTAAGTIRPASVLILGAGIAGLQAIGTAKRLGAVVTAFDVRPESEEEIESLGAKFLDLGKYGAPNVMQALFAGQGEGGYARQLTPEELELQKTATDEALKDFNIVITTAQVPGRKPPQFISKTGVQNMKAGSIIVDLAASDLGGNVEGSKPYETVELNGVQIIGAPNLASETAKSASSLLARNFAEVAQFFVKADETKQDFGELDAMVISGRPKQETESPVVEESAPNANSITSSEAIKTEPENAVIDTKAEAEGSQNNSTEIIELHVDDENQEKREEK
jgi:NAD(P) transhydrogenase subunit alpha